MNERISFPPEDVYKSSFLPSPPSKYNFSHGKKCTAWGRNPRGWTGRRPTRGGDRFQPHLYLAAVSSRSRTSAEKLAAKYAPEARIYEHYQDMLADPRVDIVSQCMPNYLHAREAIISLEADKHLILEKPVVVSYEELEALRSTARRTKGKSVASFVLRWHPLALALKGLLDKKAIGEIFYNEIDYWHGIKPTFASYPWIRKQEFAGGAMITGGCHASDLARYLKGEIEEVSASLDGLAFPYQFNIDLLGSKGAVRDNRLFSRELYPRQEDWAVLPYTTPNSGLVQHHPFKQEIDNLAEHILNGAPILSDVLDACRSLEVALAITESARIGKPVGISPE